jgi:hypothetical protein
VSQPAAAKKARGALYRWFERLVLGLAMSLLVFVVERRILKALKMGGVHPAPRTAAPQPDPRATDPSPIETSREAQLSTAKQINHQADR